MDKSLVDAEVKSRTMLRSSGARSIGDDDDDNDNGERNSPSTKTKNIPLRASRSPTSTSPRSEGTATS